MADGEKRSKVTRVFRRLDRWSKALSRRQLRFEYCSHYSHRGQFRSNSLRRHDFRLLSNPTPASFVSFECWGGSILFICVCSLTFTLRTLVFSYCVFLWFWSFLKKVCFFLGENACFFINTYQLMNDIEVYFSANKTVRCFKVNRKFSSSENIEPVDWSRYFWNQFTLNASYFEISISTRNSFAKLIWSKRLEIFKYHLYHTDIQTTIHFENNEQNFTFLTDISSLLPDWNLHKNKWTLNEKIPTKTSTKSILIN